MLPDAWSTCWLSAVMLTGRCSGRHGRRVCRRLVGPSGGGDVGARSRPVVALVFTGVLSGVGGVSWAEGDLARGAAVGVEAGDGGRDAQLVPAGDHRPGRPRIGELALVLPGNTAQRSSCRLISGNIPLRQASHSCPEHSPDRQRVTGGSLLGEALRGDWPGWGQPGVPQHVPVAAVVERQPVDSRSDAACHPAPGHHPALGGTLDLDD